MDNLQLKISNILLVFLIISLWGAAFLITQVIIDTANYRAKTEMKQIKQEIYYLKDPLPPPELDAPIITYPDFEVEVVEIPGMPNGNL
jgi:hypothetical protein